MTPEIFLNRVLPERGMRVVVSIGQKVNQWFFGDNAAAARWLLGVDSKGANAYHACATFRDKSSRRADNVEAVKSLWLDIDCGPGKPYADRHEAEQALQTFTDTVGLPPALVVASGVGLHIYWVLEQAVDGPTWLRTAKLLKAATQQAGLHAGPERTADVASILRTPGTHHRKGAPLLVEVQSEGAIAPIDYIHNKLLSFVGEEADPLAGGTSALVGTNSDLIGGQYTGPDPVADHVADLCAVIGEFRADGGVSMPEPLWRACLGVVRVCADGVAIAHEWSAKATEIYSQDETQKKLDGLDGTGPTLCETIAAHRPDVCGACRFRDVCKSPTATVTKESVPAPLPPSVTTNPLIPPYRWGTVDGKDGIVVKVKDKDSDLTVDQIISDVLFYPVAKMQTRKTDYTMLIRVHTSGVDSESETFELPMNLIGEGGGKLTGFLAGHQIGIDKTMALPIQRYLNAWLAHQRKHAAASKTYDHFGWEPDGFIIADKIVKFTGGDGAVALTNSAKGMRDALIPSGDASTWASLVDRAYNNDFSIPMQFAVLTSMAAPLLSFFRDYGGCTVYLHSEKSGYGKTTVERVAMSVWGRWSQLQLTRESMTLNALNTVLGAARNLPVIVDELTAMSDADACAFVHIVSSGSPKKRVDQRGELIDRGERWQTFVIASGNVLLSEKMAQHRAHAEAEVARLWQYTLPKIDRRNTVLEPEEAMRLFPQFDEQFGTAGEALVRYYVQNHAAIKQELYDTQSKVSRAYKLTQTERYWTTLISCVLVAHRIATDLGLIKFNRQALKVWILETLAANRQGMSAAATNPADVFRQMMLDLTPDFLITQGEGDLYKGHDAYIIQRPRFGCTGRVVTKVPGALGQGDREAVYISADAARSWCSKRNISAAEVFKAAVGESLILPRARRYHLGKGSSTYSSTLPSVECWVGDIALVGPVTAPSTLSVIQGGKP